MVAQQGWSGVAKIVGIKGGADSKGKDLAGMHVLHDDSAVGRAGALHGGVEGLFGDELDVFVDREDEIVAGLGFMFGRAHHMAARVHGGVHAARLAVQAAVEFLLHTAEAVIVDADVAEDLRGDFAVGIETLEFLLEVNALEVEGFYFGCGFRAEAAGDPCEAA